MEKLGKVEDTALLMNGWHAIAIHKARYSDGTVPYGYLAFVRQSGPFEGKLCGTAMWSIIPATGSVLFTQGHYDLSRNESLTDLMDRIMTNDLAGFEEDAA